MNIASRIRHSFAGKAVRTAIHLMFQVRHPGLEPVTYELPGDIKIRLYPEGEIAEFLAFPWLFEKTEVALTAAFLQPGMSVIDVGANIGLYSILANMRVRPGGTVWAFEPSDESATRLERNLILNDCSEVRVSRLALSDTRDTSLPLVSDRGYGDAYRYLRPSENPIRDDKSQAVPVTTLDCWAAANGIERSDFLKVDIEGGEYRMFLGARDFLTSNVNLVMMFECESDWCARAGCSPRDVFDLLTSLGFSLYAWNGRSRQWDDASHTFVRSGMFWAARKRSLLPDPIGG